MIDHDGLSIDLSESFEGTGPLDPATWRVLEHEDLDIWPSDARLATDHEWQPWQAGIHPSTRTGHGRAMQEVNITRKDGCGGINATTAMPPGPAVMVYSGISTQERHINPGLAGTSSLEVTLEGYAPGGDFLNTYLSYYGNPDDAEDPVGGRYVMGWGMTIGSVQGFVTGKEDGGVERAVQLHFDGWSRYGWSTILCRNVIPGDDELYSEFDHTTEQYESKPKPFIAQPCLILSASRDFQGVRETHFGHRFGLCLTDSGDTVYWTLDGRVMDTVDISGFFQSSPDAVGLGAYASICMGGSYQENTWKLSDVRLYRSA